MFVLDTNVVSELRRAKSGRADSNVVAWASAVPVVSLFISAISILELEVGVLQIERRDASQGQMLRAWLDRQILPAFDGRVLAIDTSVARRCAQMHVPDRRSERDAMIAATAIVHGMNVATRNVADFAGTGAKVINPWESA